MQGGDRMTGQDSLCMCFRGGQACFTTVVRQMTFIIGSGGMTSRLMDGKTQAQRKTILLGKDAGLGVWSREDAVSHGKVMGYCNCGAKV